MCSDEFFIFKKRKKRPDSVPSNSCARSSSGAAGARGRSVASSTTASTTGGYPASIHGGSSVRTSKPSHSTLCCNTSAGLSSVTRVGASDNCSMAVRRAASCRESHGVDEVYPGLGKICRESLEDRTHASHASSTRLLPRRQVINVCARSQNHIGSFPCLRV